MAPSTYAHIKVKTLVNGELCYNNFYYQSTVSSGSGFAGNALNAWQTKVQTAWLDILTPDARIVDLSIQVGHNPPLPYFEEYTIPVNQPGVLAGEILPPFMTLTLLKVPNNALIDPPLSQPFNRPGRIPISGCGENMITNGYINSGGAALLQALGTALEDFAYNAGPDYVDMYLSMFRYPTPSVPNFVGTYVDEVVVGRVGTQNTRKG